MSAERSPRSGAKHGGLLAALAALMAAPAPRTDGKPVPRELTKIERMRNRQQRVRDLSPAGRTYLFGIRVLKNPPTDKRERTALAKHIATMAGARGSQAVLRARRRPKAAYPGDHA